MKSRWAQSGFTIVELLIVIVVIGILAAISIVAFNGIQRRVIDSSARSSLAQVGRLMETHRAIENSYPTTLPSGTPTSADFDFTLVATASRTYAGLSPVQNGVLFAQLCQELVSEGLGSGLNSGGGTDAYVTGCGNWNSTGIQIQGWSSAGLGRNFSTPLNEADLTNYIDSIPAGDSYHPNQQPIVKNFLSQLRNRFTQQGGAFPINSFWDNWATPGNGVMMQALPAPTIIPAGSSYCVEASYKKSPDQKWHIKPNATATEGGC